MKAFKVFETQNFERGGDPMDTLKLGDVQGRLLKIRRAEAIQAMEEILEAYGGDGPFFYNKGDGDDETGFKIGIIQDDPIYSRFKLDDGGNDIRYYIEFNVTEENFYVGWEQENKYGRWMERQWTSKVPFNKINKFKSLGDIQTTEIAKQILIEFIQDNRNPKQE